MLGIYAINSDQNSCMQKITVFLILLAAALSLTAQTVVPSATAMPAWTPPAPRTKATTLFAPKPFKGDNIFKGDGEKWLAEAIVNLEVGQLRPISDKQVSDYVEQLGQNLAKYSAAPNKTFQFMVLNDHENNAFSIGGGRIFIDLGALQAAASEDELASIIAHEIGHDVFMHAPKTVTRQLFWMTGKRKIADEADAEKALQDLEAAYEKHTLAAVGESLLGWSRFDELEADKAGFYNMYKAGYNPEAMKNVFRKFVAETKAETGDNYADAYFFELLFGSHPPSSQRVTALKWESNWVKMPPKESQYKNAAFDAMKVRVRDL
jgi:predicted Zn-dependent protease